MTQDFKDHPKSFTELRSEREDDAKIWTPRDVLIAMLRRIDSGEAKPDVLVVISAVRNDNGQLTEISGSGNRLELIGLCTAGANLYFNNDVGIV